MVEYKYPLQIIRTPQKYTWVAMTCMLPIYHDLSLYDLRGIDIYRNYAFCYLFGIYSIIL